MLRKVLRVLLPAGSAAAVLAIAAATPANVAPVSSVSLSDSFSYVWSLTVVEMSATGWFLDGKMATTFDSRTANGMLLLSTKTATMGADAGTGVPFAYSVKFQGSSGQGIWTNFSGDGAGNGDVTVTVTGPNPPPPVDPGTTHGSVPGFEIE